ncbi:MAG: hypothetical protein KatS3mg126_1538 [Lysobacteraceae bacterium]|nr:MAG: hypothetical protein KatS3mg126_1538 [Xanthomonadaceae bacterium]
MAKLKSSSKSRAKPAAKRTTRKPAAAARKQAEGLPRSIMESAQQIWMAGMGAFARAQQEGTRLFETLVKEGMNLERHTRKLATGKVEEVREVVEKNVDQVRERAADTWDRLEKVFEERVQRALNRLGVPTREDLQGLSRRVDQLNAELRKLSQPKATKSSNRTAVRKTARTTARKAGTPAPAEAPVQESAD